MNADVFGEFFNLPTFMIMAKVGERGAGRFVVRHRSARSYPKYSAPFAHPDRQGNCDRSFDDDALSIVAGFRPVQYFTKVPVDASNVAAYRCQPPRSTFSGYSSSPIDHLHSGRHLHLAELAFTSVVTTIVYITLRFGYDSHVSGFPSSSSTWKCGRHHHN